MSGRIVDVNGLSIYTHILGEGPAVLWLHGFTGSHRTFLRFAENLPGYTHVLPDLAGHGQSSVGIVPARVRIPLMVRDLVDLMESLGYRRFAVIGYSMGGRVALAMGATMPASVNRMLLESASPGIEGARARADRRRVDSQRAAAIEDDGVSAFVQAWAQLPLFATQSQINPALLVEQQAIRLGQSSAGLRASLLGHGTGIQRSYWADLVRMTFPVQLVTGDKDGKFTATADRMMRYLPNGAHQMVPGAGHTVHVEAPDRFGTMLEAFLTELKGEGEG